MPRDAITLADVREPTVELLCEPCGRRGRYNVERLIAAPRSTPALTADEEARLAALTDGDASSG